LPQIDLILSRLPRAMYISSLDLKDAYWQIPLEPKSRRFSQYRKVSKVLKTAGLTLNVEK